MRSRLLACLILLAAPAVAQTLPTPPAEREPNAASVREREAAAGVAPTAQQRQQEGATVNQLFRDLTGTSPNAPVAPMAPSGPPMSQEGAAVNQLYRDLTGQNPNTPPR
ncbi:hypothetical protein [Roseomonas sp. AR75]|uniref:hypothetical protein n=1 Tax=Roseomonas sp. AR75 TaxID=2562311 RepID=UPI0010C0B3CE|nr:hypothetical protein [Roseomonas sp. AR75]